MAKDKKIMGIIIVIILVIATIFLFTYQQPSQNTKSSLEIVDYDKNGNVIQRVEIELAIKKQAGLQSIITVPPEFQGTYIQKQLPPIPREAIHRVLTLKIVNTGNVVLDVSVIDPIFSATYVDQSGGEKGGI